MNITDDNSQRYTPFRAAIPFYILYDLDLNANHLRLYGQIDQMESYASPPFSFAWFAEQLMVDKQVVVELLNTLLEKGYVKKIEHSNHRWSLIVVKKFGEEVLRDGLL